MKNIYDVIIIGSGPAGYSAAIYCARGNLKTLMISGYNIGGQLMLTTEIENYPGFSKSITGYQLMEEMRKQSENVGVEIIQKDVTEVDFHRVADDVFKVFCNGDKFLAKRVIISTGASAKSLGVEGEEEYRNKGVSMCATCDGPFFKNKDVLVVGGGNAAVEEAIFLSKICSNVTLIHRRDKLRAEQILQERLFQIKNLNILWNHELKRVIGDGKRVTGAILENNLCNTASQIELNGVFIAIGHTPNTHIFKDYIKCRQNGYIEVKNQVFTNIDGVFAAGDVADDNYRQAVTAAGLGCIAALEVIRSF